MTIQELIKALSIYPSEMPVLIGEKNREWHELRLVVAEQITFDGDEPVSAENVLMLRHSIPE